MHRFLLLTCLLGSVCSTPILEDRVPEEMYGHYELALKAILGMGQRLTALLGNSSQKNFVVSPLSTTSVIGQLMLGAEGKFRDELYQLLALPEDQNNYTTIKHTNRNQTNQKYVLPYGRFHLQLCSLLKTLRSSNEDKFTLHENSALFYNEDIDLRQDFEERLNRLYDALIIPLDFHGDTRKVINKWASKNTNGLINTVLADQPPPSTSSIFLNSVYFKAEWEYKFDADLNHRGNFFVKENTTVETTYMLRTLRDVPYAETKDYRIVCLPYLNKELGMYVLLPKIDNPHKYDIKNFVLNLDAQELYMKLGNLRLRDVTVKFPKLYLTNEVDILDPLKKYIEIKSATEESSDSTDQNNFREMQKEVDFYQKYKPSENVDIILTGAAKNANLRMSKIVQQMVLSVTEDGTEAAAVTSVITDYMHSDNFILNRPFSFLIKHEATSAVIFWGTISDPS